MAPAATLLVRRSWSTSSSSSARRAPLPAPTVRHRRWERRSTWLERLLTCAARPATDSGHLPARVGQRLAGITPAAAPAVAATTIHSRQARCHLPFKVLRYGSRRWPNDRNWMLALARHYDHFRSAYPTDRLLIVFEIDGPIVDGRHMVRRRLLDYDRMHGTDHFRGHRGGRNRRGCRRPRRLLHPSRPCANGPAGRPRLVPAVNLTAPRAGTRRRRVPIPAYSR